MNKYFVPTSSPQFDNEARLIALKSKRFYSNYKKADIMNDNRRMSYWLRQSMRLTKRYSKLLCVLKPTYLNSGFRNLDHLTESLKSNGQI